jgi:Fe-S cluster biogenesis protein NfuA
MVETREFMREQVQTAINEKIRPLLIGHGGDVELVGIDETTGTVTVRLQGACSQCPSAHLTLRAGVERLLRQHVPAVKDVVAA